MHEYQDISLSRCIDGDAQTVKYERVSYLMGSLARPRLMEVCNE